MFIFFGLLLSVPAYMYLHRPPSCTDGIQNQGETDVDKGGSCPKLDERMLAPHAVLWARAFRVRDGSYSAAAYIENPNENAAIVPTKYKFRLYDAENILVAEREGSTFVMPGGITAVFEPAIDAGNRVVTHTFFAFTAPPVWRRATVALHDLRITKNTPTDTDTTPRVKASVTNTGVSTISDMRLVAVVFDVAGNAFASSQTRVDRLGANESIPVVFTWPDPFVTTVGRIDILPIVIPRDVTP